MRKRLTWITLVVAILIPPAGSLGQEATTGSLTGNVSSSSQALPGVTVTVTSPNLQRSRSTHTNVNGDYQFSSLPPGDYDVLFELEGMDKVRKSVHVALAREERADAELTLRKVEEITVRAVPPAVLETTEVQRNYRQEVIDRLPIGRDITSIALLSNGTTSGFPRPNIIAIAGAVSSDNLILVDGAVIQENLRGQAHPLYIEDAIQETTVITGSVSAEYGRFTGGVVSSITRSGGNERSGSLRDTIDNTAWKGRTPYRGQQPAPHLNQLFESTLGGRIIQDRLWYFTAARYSDRPEPHAFVGSSESFATGIRESRLEAKVTALITPKQSWTMTSLTAPHRETAHCEHGCFDAASLDPETRQRNNFLTVHYSNVAGNNLLLEANYARKRFESRGSGGHDTDLVRGTPVSYVTPDLSNFIGDSNAPPFCGFCGGEDRNNRAWSVKGGYYLGSRRFGTHDLVAGFESWSETRRTDNHYSATDYIIGVLSGHPARAANGDLLVSASAGIVLIGYFPVAHAIGSDLSTRSLFFNDRWSVNRHLSLNIGVRSDRNDAVDNHRSPTSHAQSVVPRLGMIYDVRADRRLRLTASFSRYTGRLSEYVQGVGSPTGDPSVFYYAYGGPPIVNQPVREFARTVFDWFQAHPRQLAYAQIAGLSNRIDARLRPPTVSEWTIGAGSQLGRGFVRVDAIRRSWSDLYASINDRNTGQVTDPASGVRADLALIKNTNGLQRNYHSVQMQGGLQIPRAALGANYTWSRLRGNAVQEDFLYGPRFESLQYPEFGAFPQNNPVGSLPSDQRHKFRAWATIDASTGRGSLVVGLLGRYDSGAPYSLQGLIDDRAFVDPSVVAAYQTPPRYETYFFSGRGALHWQSASAVDLALNYSVMGAHGTKPFVHATIVNLTNRHAQIGGLTPVQTSLDFACRQTNGDPCLRFDPFTSTPIEGVHYRRTADFGKPIGPQSYQDPRSYQLSVGVRF